MLWIWRNVCCNQRNLIEEHQGRINDISIYGQESNQTTGVWQNELAIRGIDSSQVKWNNEGSF